MKQILPLVFCMAACHILFARYPETTVPELITIPVVVHILYSNSQQNIGDAQVRSQIDILNRDFSGTNNDRNKVPYYFAGLSADCGFQFQLASVDPQGFKTNGIVRKRTGTPFFGKDDRVKFSTLGGDDAWDKNSYLNIWVCNLAGIMGYTGIIDGPPDKDGVVIRFSAFGDSGTVVQPFHLGRTATHEVGHWLNLRHIWGDAYCGDDAVDDTPRQRTANRGAPDGIKFTCDMNGYGDMYMNFMDLTDDASMHMFTNGQRERMRDLFRVHGLRHILLGSKALSAGTERLAISGIQVGVAPELVVFPNPAHTVITIKTNDLTNHSLVVYNQGGQRVATQLMTGQFTVVRIASFTAGVYYIKRENDASFTRFIKK